MSVTFRSWLKQPQQLKRNDPTGDVARDLETDYCCHAHSYVGILKHICSIGNPHGQASACEEARVALKEAYDDYLAR